MHILDDRTVGGANSGSSALGWEGGKPGAVRDQYAVLACSALGGGGGGAMVGWVMRP